MRIKNFFRGELLTPSPLSKRKKEMLQCFSYVYEKNGILINERSPKKNFFYIFCLFLLILYNIFYVKSSIGGFYLAYLRRGRGAAASYFPNSFLWVFLLDLLKSLIFSIFYELIYAFPLLLSIELKK